MEQIKMDFENKPEEQPEISELESETQRIMNGDDPRYHGNHDAAQQLAEINLRQRKSGKPTVEIHDHFED